MRNRNYPKEAETERKKWTRVSARLPNETYQELKEKAGGMSIAQTLIMLIRKYLGEGCDTEPHDI